MTTEFHTPLSEVSDADELTFNSIFSDLDSGIVGIKNRVVEDTVDPTASDDSYDIGTVWVNTARDRAWQCVDNTADDASWVFVAGEVYCDVYNSAHQSIPDTTVTNPTFDTEISDLDDMFPGSGSTFTFPFDGVYQVNFQLRWNTNSNGFRMARYAGSHPFSPSIRQLPVSGNITDMLLAQPIKANASDSLLPQVQQTSGGPLDILNQSTLSPRVTIIMTQGYINRK